MNFTIKFAYQVVVWKGMSQKSTHLPRLSKLFGSDLVSIAELELGPLILKGFLEKKYFQISSRWKVFWCYSALRAQEARKSCEDWCCFDLSLFPQSMTGITGLTTLKALRSLKGPRLDLHGFYLIIIKLNIRWVLTKYNIKPLGVTKTQGFSQDLYVYDFFYTRRDYLKTSPRA